MCNAEEDKYHFQYVFIFYFSFVLFKFDKL